MRVISNKPLRDFAADHPDADEPLQAWRKTVEATEFKSYADLKRSFNSVDKVGDCYVFDIGGNKFRVVSGIFFKGQCLYVRHVMTHKEYDKWKP